MHSINESGAKTLNDNGDQINDAWWAARAASLLHPVQVEIIEALRWTDQSLSAADLAEIRSQALPWPHLVHHLRRLTRIGAIERAERLTPRNVATIRFRLAVKKDDDER